MVDENIFPTPLFRIGDLDWSNYRGKLYGGSQYVLIREGIKTLKNQFRNEVRKNCVITFGGSDPQNFTLKLMMSLAHLRKKLQIVVILGPRFKYVESVLAFNLKVGNKFKIVRDQKDVDYYIASAKLLITALGITTLEAIFLNITCICISNKKEDRADLGMLKKFDDVYVLDDFREIKDCKKE